MRTLFAATLTACFIGLGGMSCANATLVTISTSDSQIQAGVDNQGWWSSTSPNGNAVNDNYFTGADSGPDEFRSFFSFDLSGVSGTVTSATFDVRRYVQSGSVTLDLFDVSTPAATLITTRTGATSATIFADLGSGTNYGSFLTATGASTDILSFALNAAALADINATLGTGYFSIGAALLSGGSIFSFSGEEPGNSGGVFNSVQRLVLNVEQANATAVPEPSSLALLCAGLLGLGGLRRRAKKA